MRTTHRDAGLPELSMPFHGIIRVGWEEPEDGDPDNPQNWSSMAKWANILTISVISFLVCVLPVLFSRLASG